MILLQFFELLIQTSGFLQTGSAPRYKASTFPFIEFLKNIYAIMEKISKEEMDMAFFISRLFSKKQKTIVELCQTNLDRFYHEEHLTEYKTFFTRSQINYREYSCLNECKTCKLNPYVKLNHQIISGSSPKDVLQQLIKNEE